MLIQLRKNPLSPFVIFWISCRNFFCPIIAKPKPLQLLLKVNFRLIVRYAWRFPDFNSVIFNRQTKAIPADWMIDIIALLTLESCLDVGKLKSTTVTNVNSRPCNPRKHTQAVIFLSGRVIKINRVSAVSLPFVLPFLFNFCRIIASHICNYSK